MTDHPVAVSTWICLATLAGCAPEPPLPADTPLAEFPFAWAVADCAPWDGPAVLLSFSPVDPGNGAEPIAPLSVSLWKPLDALTGRTWRWPEDEQAGSASWCPSGDTCEAATSGVVRIDSARAGGTVVGRLRLEFSGRSPVEGGFRAEWRERQALCG